MATTTGIFQKNKDAGQPLDITEELTINDLVRYTVPAGGPFVTGAPQSNTLVEGTDILLSPLATIAADTLSDPMTAANVLLFKEVSESAVSAKSDFEPHIFEVTGTGAGASGGSPYMFQSFVAEQDGFYLPEPTEYDIYRNQTGTNRVSAHIQLNSSTTGGGTYPNPNELWRQYLQKASRPAGSTTDIAVTNDNGGPYIASVPVQLVKGATYYLYHISNTGQFRNTNTARVKFTKVNTDPQLELPTSMAIVDQTTNGAQNLNSFVDNAVYRSNNTGPLNGTGFGNWTWRVKATRIGNWCQQMMWNDTGNIAFRESFNADAPTPTWTAWAI